MKRFMAIIFILASLGLQARCVCMKLPCFNKPKVADDTKKQSRTVDFNGLNKYLVETLPGKTELQTNLDHIEANIDQLDGPTRRADELLLKVPDIKNGCDDQYMTIIRDIRSDFDYIDIHFGQKRIEKLLRNAGLDRSVVVCKDYLSSIEKNISGNEKYAKLFYALGPVAHFQGDIFRKNDRYMLIDVIKRLIDQDPEAQYGKIYNELTGLPKLDEKKFLDAFKSYLYEPCRQLVSERHLEQFIRDAAYFESFRQYSPHKQDSTFFLDIYILDSIRDKCIRVLNMDALSRIYTLI